MSRWHCLLSVLRRWFCYFYSLFGVASMVWRVLCWVFVFWYYLCVLYSFAIVILSCGWQLSVHSRVQRGGGGQGVGTPWKITKNLGFFSSTSLDPWKSQKLLSQYSILGHNPHLNGISLESQWWPRLSPHQQKKTLSKLDPLCQNFPDPRMACCVSLSRCSGLISGMWLSQFQVILISPF